MATHIIKLANRGDLPDGSNSRIALVVSDYYKEITDSLTEGARKVLSENGVHQKNIEEFKVPGAFELTLAALWAAESERFDAIICLGCVVKGETRHDEYINDAVAKGLTQVSIDNALPVIFGLLTTENYQQALDRAGGSAGNKGEECAAAALRMIALQNKIFTEQ
jgi:6,7-dimethyl-8-ribityllumazine synthase